MPLIYIVFFLFCLLFVKSKRRKFDVSCYIYMIYLVCAICFGIVYYGYPKSIQFPERITLTSVSAHLLLLSIFFFPFVHYSSKLDFTRFQISDKGLKIFEWCLIVPSIAAIFVSSADVIRIVAFGDYSVARTAYLEGDIDAGYISRYGLLGYIMSFGPQTCFLSVTMFFYSFFYKGDKKMGLLMFIASFALVIQNLSIAGREGFIRWMLYFGFNFVLFRDHVSYKGHRSFWILIALGVSIMLFFFRAISIDRFEDSTYGTLYSLFSYAGQPFYYFSYAFNEFATKNISGFGSIFTIVTGNEVKRAVDNLSLDFALNTFPTFVGSFIAKVGFWRTLLLGSVWCIVLSYIFSRKRSMSFSSAVTYIIFYDVILFGVLYFIHYPRFTQITMVVYIIVAWVISTLYSKKFIKNSKV